jgi:hypothetical protein
LRTKEKEGYNKIKSVTTWATIKQLISNQHCWLVVRKVLQPVVEATGVIPET